MFFPELTDRKCFHIALVSLQLSTGSQNGVSDSALSTFKSQNYKTSNEGLREALSLTPAGTPTKFPAP